MGRTVWSVAETLKAASLGRCGIFLPSSDMSLSSAQGARRRLVEIVAVVFPDLLWPVPWTDDWMTLWGSICQKSV